MKAEVDSIGKEQARIIDEFSQFEDWTDRYEYLIDLGKALPPFPEQYRDDAHLVKGCQSRVWLHAEHHNGHIQLFADSDTVITKGIIALLLRVFNGKPADEIEQADLHFIEAIGLKAHLSPTRSNGLNSMIQHIKSYARLLGTNNENNTEDSDLNGLKQLMVDQVKTIYDPEIPVDIWELGLIYQLDINQEGKVNVTMTLTSPACPVAGSLPLEVQEKLLSLPFVKDVQLSLVWDPPWNKERMSDEARMALDMF